MIGKTLAHYQVTDKLGAGGMGEVYRARDTKLGRDVAIKVLPEDWSQDRERLDRFEREARMLASLNHPNIASIYGFEASGGIHFIVLEVVEGDTLADRLRRRPLPIEQTLEVCQQIAEALETAHEQGIIHRDLKPANVKVTPKGTVKVLDFGLAKTIVRSVPSSSEDPGSSATLDREWSDDVPLTATREGVILGTPSYMSPEQARGGQVDRRSDIWSFGCLFFECLTGRRAFAGETATDSIGAALHKEPDWDRLPNGLSSNVRTLLRRCLEKDPRRRLQHIGDVRVELSETLEPPRFQPPLTRERASGERPRAKLPWVVAGVALVVAVFSFVKLQERSGPRAIVSTSGFSSPVFRVVLPPDQRWMPSTQSWQSSAVVVSPDAGSLVYTAIERGQRRLFQRSLDDLTTEPISGTEGARFPMYSPDGEWIAFFADGVLKKKALRGGQIVDLAHLEPFPIGGCWAPDGYVYFTSGPVLGSLARVPTEGVATAPETLTTPDRDAGEMTHFYPHALPGGDSILFSVLDDGWNRDEARVGVLDLDSRTVSTLKGIRGSSPHHVSTGHLIVSRAEQLLAVPFDVDTKALLGSAYSVQNRVTTIPASQFSLSKSGTLAYVPARAKSRLVWVDHTGEFEALSFEVGRYAHPRLSPDGDDVVVEKLGDDSNHDIYVGRLESETLRKLTRSVAFDSMPIWSPDGESILYISTRGMTTPDIYQAPHDRDDDSARALIPARQGRTGARTPSSWTRSGELVFTDQGDIWTLDPGSNEVRPFFKDEFEQRTPAVHPGGDWIAYASDETESGRVEVFVQRFPEAGGKVQVSNAGGFAPVWARSGDRLYFQGGSSLFMAAVVESGERFVTEPPRILFGGPYLSDVSATHYDVHPDGQRFLMIRTTEPEQAPPHFVVVLDWFEKVKALGMHESLK